MDSKKNINIKHSATNYKAKKGNVMEVKAILKNTEHDNIQKEGAEIKTESTPIKTESTHRQPEWIVKKDLSSSITLYPETKKIIFLSVDVETDGPVPGLYSMLSIGLAAFNVHNEIIWEQEINLFPLEDASKDRKTMEWWQEEEQKEAWEHLLINQQNPKANSY